MDERTLDRLAELIHNHIHSSHLILMVSIQAQTEKEYACAYSEALQRTRDSLWKAIIHLMREERDMIDTLANAIEKQEPCTAGNLGCIVDCCNEKLEELKKLAEVNDIAWVE